MRGEIRTPLHHPCSPEAGNWSSGQDFIDDFMGVARIFQRGGHTLSNRGYSRFRNLNIVGCLSKKRLTKGGHGHPRTPPLATPLDLLSSSGILGIHTDLKLDKVTDEKTIHCNQTLKD